MRRIVINPGTEWEVNGRLYEETPEEVTVITHMGSLLKFTRDGNTIKFPGEVPEPEEKPQSPHM